MNNNFSSKGFAEPTSVDIASVNVIAVPEPSVRLYSPIKVLVATLLGGIAGGCILHWLNLKALQQDKRANRTLVEGVAMLMLFPIFLLLTHIPVTGVGGAAAGVYLVTAQRTYGDIYKQHANSQGKLGGWWATIGIGILSLVVSIFIAIPIGILVALVLHK